MTLGKYKYIWKIFVRYDSLQYAGRAGAYQQHKMWRKL